MNVQAIDTETDGQAASPLRVDVRDDGVAIITYDVPGESVNTLRADFVDSFGRAFAEVAENPDVRAAVLVSGKADSFIVGADIGMLEALQSTDDAEAMVRRGHEAIARLVDSPKPVVAAIHGQALGGGFEVALACHARVLSSSPKTMLGLPEVQLGLLPGISGLQRLAALTNLQVALDYGLTGKNMRADKAKKLGVADDVVPAAILVEVACARALALVAGRKGSKRARFGVAELTELALEKNPLGRKLLFSKAREALLKKTGGHYPAAERIVDVLEVFASDGLEASQVREAACFGELVTSDVSANLRSIFFATTALKKDSGVDDPEVEARPVKKIAMLGAGLMGAGIAYVSIDKGYDVRLKDRDFDGLSRGVKYVDDILRDRVTKRRLDKPGRAERMARLSTTVDYRGMGNVDLVIEAVFEDLELKQRVLREVEEGCPEGVIFASNTSSIPIGRIAEAAKRPENVVGMHYFSPVHKMPLLEVIRTAQSDDEVVATAVAVGKRQGKTVIVVNDGVGFYTSRVLGPYMNEASYILTEGVAIEDIDRAMTTFGWPVGPLTLVDEVGIDVAAHVGPIMVEAFGERLTPPPTVSRLVDDGRKGRKNERGFYLYGAAAKKAKSRKPVDPSVYGVLGLDKPSPGRSPVPWETIQERCNLQFVNEAFHCLGEGILRSARDGDVGAIFGLGFPPFLGGPFRWVDALGPAKVLSRIEAYEDQFGKRWTPAPALVELAKSGKRLHEVA
jgi:3-hydroxyacyl-CoA dehydrogenase / enoyl-CoA hydratase / 3-hydroxybutyryl-CoA epimerase